jgi:hypothetical protein
MSEVTKLIQLPLRIETMTKPDRAKDWVRQMGDYHATYDKWHPIMKMMVHFSELFHEKTRTYMEWFSRGGQRSGARPVAGRGRAARELAQEVHGHRGGEGEDLQGDRGELFPRGL